MYTNSRESGEWERDVSPCEAWSFFLHVFLLLFLTCSAYLLSSLEAASGAAQRLPDAVMRILRIGPSAFGGCVFKQIPPRFIHPWLCFERGPATIRPAYLHGCSGLFGGEVERGANLDKADSVCRGIVRVCMQVNVL